MGILNSLQRRFAQRRNRRRTENPSILDYNQNERKLVLDMSGIKTRLNAKSRAESEETSLNDTATDMQSISNKSSTSFSQEEVEWSLPLVDKEVTEPQTMEEEIKRLKTLSDYFVLDSDGEEEFDRLTRMGSQMFDVPMCLISLVDLGRQWFLSKVGLDAAETPRKHAFCAHVILNKYKILVVPDATQDFRFKDNPLVTGPPDIRFYAGAALISPEGYKLGTFCVISPVPRPQGLSEAEQELLHNMAATTVSTMVARRNRLVKEEYEGRFLTSARSLLETNQNVEKSQKILVELLQKEAWNLDSETGAEISAVSRNLALASNVCSALARSMLEAGTSTSPEQTDSTNDKNGGAEEKKEMHDDASTRVSTPKKVEDIMKEYDMITSPTTDMVQFFDNINAIIPSFPFQGQVSVEIDGSVPKVIIAEDLLLFRSTLNMLTHCMGQINNTEPSKTDPALQKSGLRIRRMK